MEFNTNKKIDVITIGRANVDFYPPVGDTLSTARSYDVFVGGSPANIAVGMSKLGMAAGIITRVGNDAHGEFVKKYLQGFDIDTSEVQQDPCFGNTSLAFAERRVDANTIMYRNQAADTKLDPEMISEKYIADAKCLFVSGASLALSPAREALFKALEYAQKNDCVSAIDLDYRPYGWTSEEETRSVMYKAAAGCKLVIGTHEEFEHTIGKSSRTDKEIADLFLNENAEIVIVKRGRDGASLFSNDGCIENPIFPAKVVKPYGAGDSFASAFLAFVMKGRDLKEALRAGAASASLNISGYSCTEEMADEEKLMKFIERCDNGEMQKEGWE